MRSLLKLALTAGAICLALPAYAQSVDTGNEVSVNPLAVGRGTLLYPGGQYMRNVPALLQPGQTNAPIHLHMPSRHRRVTVASAAPAATPAPVEQPAPPPKPRRHPKTVASAAPAPAAPVPSAPIPSLFGGPSLSLTPVAPVSKPATPAPAQTPGLTKRSVILFAKDSDSPAIGAIGNIKLLAGDLNASMVRASSRIELQAFGGAKGDKGSDARRLSLKRALAIRQVMMDSGVASDRIDVRAMGGVDDDGPTDRVDVYVKA